MKVSAVIITLAICVVFYHQGVQASVSKCYHCVNTCSDPLDVEDCQPSNTIEYKCVSAKANEGGQESEIKGCIPVNDGFADSYCDPIEKNGGDCFICDTDLCNSAGIYSVSVLLVSCLIFLLIKIL